MKIHNNKPTITMKLIFWRRHINNDEKPKETEADEGDYIVNCIGNFGLWQLLYIVIAALSRFIAGWNTMAIIFLTPDTKFVCAKFSDNNTIELKENICYKNCEEYEYVRNVFDKTLVTEFDLVCEKAWLASFTQTVMMFGLLLGVSLFGWFSDRYGRSKALFLSGLTNIVFMFAVPFSPTYWAITACRFFIGLGSGGIYSLTAVYTSELIGKKLIETVTCLALLPDGIAIAAFAIFAQFSTNWRTFSLEYSIVSVFIVILLFFLPETPRWLIANGKTTEAIKVLTKAAEFNKKNTEHIQEQVIKSVEELKLKEAPNLNYIDLFRSKKLAFRTVSSFIIWFVVGLVYFGVNQYVSQLGGNLIIDIIILGLLEIPAAPIAIIMTKYLGRKISAIASFIIIGGSMIILIFIPEGSIASTTMGGIGITAATAVFSVVYLLVIELYPTPMRNMGFSLSSAGSKLGAMAAPFVANMKPRSTASSVFGVAPFIGILFCMVLPETKGRKLKDTVEETKS